MISVSRVVNQGLHSDSGERHRTSRCPVNQLFTRQTQSTENFRPVRPGIAHRLGKVVRFASTPCNPGHGMKHGATRIRVHKTSQRGILQNGSKWANVALLERLRVSSVRYLLSQSQA